MAKNLVQQYIASKSNASGIIDSSNQTITNVDSKQATLTPQIRGLLKSLDDGLGKQVVQNQYMQQNLKNLLDQMTSTFESNSRMRQDSVYLGRFGLLYWTTVISTLFFSYHVAGVLESSGHPFYGVLTMAGMLLGSAASLTFGLTKIWKRPSERNPVPALADWQTDLINSAKKAQIQYCGASLSAL